MKKTRKHRMPAIRSALTIACLSTTTVLHASVVINEIDYDQVGTDNAEFVELYNSGDSLVTLDGYFIELINGNNNSVYRSIDLGGFNIASSGYFVICNDASLVANCSYDFTDSTGWIQNGAPDAIALYDTNGILDSLSYEGEMLPFTEGTVLSVVDSNTVTASISRLPNGFDTNNNDLDYQLGCTTPGSANIAGTGDCSVPAVVPVPAAAWLFGSGLVGLVGFARRKNH